MKEPIKGKEYLCIKTVVMDSEYTAYIKEKVYISEQKGCITNEKNNANHIWTKEGMNEYFTETEETFEITKETIIKYQMKDEFPEVFKVKLEVGKWYKTKSNCLFNLNEITDNFYLGYGFTKSMTYYSDFKEYIRTELKEATEQEVFEALKNEAVKRGFKRIGCFYIKSNKLFSNASYQGGDILFNNGIWSKTKEEAEKLLNCKIVQIMSKRKAQQEGMNETSKIRSKQTNLKPKKKKRKK